MGQISSAYSLPWVRPSGQGDGRRDDDQLPAPEVDPAQGVAGHAGLQQALGRVVDAAEHHVAHEGEDGRVGVQRSESAEA